MDFEFQIPIYSINFSNKKTDVMNSSKASVLLGVSSFHESKNLTMVMEMSEESNEIRKCCEISENEPCCKLQWAPSSHQVQNELFATSSDHLRLYKPFVDYNGIWQVELSCELKNCSDLQSPLTSFDWNEQKPNYIATSSIDSTVTIWDLNTKQVIIQLLAHDSPVHDI
jgi:WD repeat-containing protein 68